MAALVVGSPPPLELLLVNGRRVVEQGSHVVTVEESALAARVARVQRDLVRKAG